MDEIKAGKYYFSPRAYDRFLTLLDAYNSTHKYPPQDLRVIFNNMPDELMKEVRAEED